MDRDTVEIEWLAVDRVGRDDWPRLERLIDDAERERAARFHFERDRHAYIAGHALVRCMLSRHAPVRPTDWRFDTNAYGRPEIARGAGLPPLRFNLSHTHGMAVVAVTLGNDIGVDVESVERTTLTPALADRYFAKAEAEHLRTLPASGLPEALYGYWTLKEAFIKAMGLGLSLPLDAFAVTLDPPGIRFSPSIAEDPSAWLLRRYQPTPAHRVALALRHPSPDRVRVTGRAADLSRMVP